MDKMPIEMGIEVVVVIKEILGMARGTLVATDKKDVYYKSLVMMCIYD